MGESKWTPGPWRTHNGRYIEAGDNDILATVETRTSAQTFHANARLIVAAPALAEALAPFALLDADLPPTMPDDKPLYAINSSRVITVGDIRRARAALALARGER